MSNTWFRWPVRVYYEDTDAGGIVYHARYVAFYERARTEMLRERQISQQQLLEQHVAFAVRSITVEYLLPAKLDDLLEIQTKITSVRGATLALAQRIVNNRGSVLSKAEVLIACVDPHRMKPIALPDFIVAELTQ